MHIAKRKSKLKSHKREEYEFFSFLSYSNFIIEADNNFSRSAKSLNHVFFFFFCCWLLVRKCAKQIYEFKFMKLPKVGEKMQIRLNKQNDWPFWPERTDPLF